MNEREVKLYYEDFKEEAGRLIASGLKGIYEEGKRLQFHALPEDGKYASTLQLYGKEIVIAVIEEFADYRDLPSIEPSVIKAEIKTLATMFAESYLWNVKNAYIKGGRLRGFNEKLLVTDWGSSLKVNVVENGQGMYVDEIKPIGWCAFRYKFAAVKIRGV